jgi:hypothetical protein
MATQAPLDINQLISAAISSKGGSDFSSNTMDPIMQYLNGTYQQAPQFDINQLYERTAPTFMSAASLGDSSPHAIAAARIKSGQAPWELWRDKNLQQQSGMSPEEWKSFINDLAGEQQTVKKAMLDQSMQQDVFQKAGMHGANASWTDTNPDGTQTYAPDAYQYAPKQFDELLANLPAELISDSDRRKSVNAKYGSPVMITDEKKKMDLLYKQVLGEMNKKEQERVYGKPMTDANGARINNDSGKQMRSGVAGRGNFLDQTFLANYGRNNTGEAIPWFDKDSKIGWNTFNPFSKGSDNPDVGTAMIESLIRRPLSSFFGLKPLLDRGLISLGGNKPRNMGKQKNILGDNRGPAYLKALELLKQHTGPMVDKQVSAIGRSDANAINAYMDRKQGSGANTQRQASDLATQVLMSLAQQGSTPLNNDIMKNAMLKRSTRNG